MAMATEFISAGGGKVRQLDIDANPISSDVIDRVLAFEAGMELFTHEADSSPAETVPDTENKAASSEKLRRLLTEKPSALPVPLAVRGSRVVVASDPSRIQSLMY